VDRDVRDEFNRLWSKVNELESNGSRPLTVLISRFDSLVETLEKNQVTWRWRVTEGIALTGLFVVILWKR
jgi:hypothetical protein